jgi:hypothetical protein
MDKTHIERKRWDLKDLGNHEVAGLARRAHLLLELQRTLPKRVGRRRNVAGLSARVETIRQARSNGEPIQAGRLLGLPELENDCWVDISGASAIAFAQPNTITAWITRGGPKRNPFPQPERFLGRLYWPLSVLSAWQKTYASPKFQKKAA